MSTLFKNLRINIGKLLGKIPDLKSQIKFLQDTNILPTSQTCTNCNKLLNKSSAEGSSVFFRCGRCKKKISIRKGTILWNSKLSLRRFILLVYSFTQQNWTYKQMENEVCITTDEESEEQSASTIMSSKSINRYSKFFRELIADYMVETRKVPKQGYIICINFVLFCLLEYKQDWRQGLHSGD